MEGYEKKISQLEKINKKLVEELSSLKKKNQ